MFSNKRNRLIHSLGVVLFILGTLDPMEGSILIATGSLFITAICFLEKIKYWKLFLIVCISIFIGVFFLFFLSSLGGFGGTSKLSLWWGLLILPYPLGWMMMVILLIIRKRPKKY